MSVPIKPCPGCGSDDIVRPHWNGQAYIGGDATTECRRCGFRADIDAWQNRTPGPATAAVIAQMRYELKVFRLLGERPSSIRIDIDKIRAMLAEHEPAKEGGGG